MLFWWFAPPFKFLWCKPAKMRKVEKKVSDALIHAQIHQINWLPPGSGYDPVTAILLPHIKKVETDGMTRVPYFHFTGRETGGVCPVIMEGGWGLYCA